MCGPVCDLYCPGGYVTDDRGCALCRCKPVACPAIACVPQPVCKYGTKKDMNGCDTCVCNDPPVCDTIACSLYCPSGFKRDANGCQICQCNPPPMCQPVTCKILCPYGFKKDANGCEICECNPATCAASECGGPPPIAKYCADGSLASLKCARSSQGTCGWTVECPPDCSQFRDAGTCAAQTACIWLQPGCSDPAIPATGCYPRASLECATRGCPAGKQCLKRTVNPCLSPLPVAPLPAGTLPAGSGDVAPPAPGVPIIAPPPPPACTVCAQAVNICL
jgi:hypothetical protein